MKFLSRFDDFESIIVDGDVQSSGLSSLYIKDSVNSILRIGNTTGDSFITYDGSELSISSDVDLRLTTPTDQDVFLITSSGNISTTAGGGTFTIGGGLTLSNFGAGYLKTDANGVVSIDTDIIEDTLDSVTDRNAVTTNAITVGGLTVDTDTLYVDATNDRVGIGTTSPATELEVKSQTGIRSSRPTSTQWVNLYYAGIESSPTNDLYITSGLGYGTIFSTNGGGEKMRITSAGNVFFNATSAASYETFGVAHQWSRFYTTSTTDYALIDVGNGTTRVRIGVDSSTGGSLATGTSAYASYIGSSGAYPLQLGSYGGVGITINSSNNVGIGTSSPSQKLDVVGNIELGGGGNKWILTDEINTGTGRLGIQAGAGSAAYGGSIFLYAHSHASHPGDVVAGISSGSNGAFRVNTHGVDTGTDLFYVGGSSGNVGIGTTSPSDRLHVEGTHATNTNYIYLSAGSSNSARFTKSDNIGTVGGALYLQAMNANNVLIATGGGNVGVGTTSPSSKFEVSTAGFDGITLSRTAQNAGSVIYSRSYDTSNVLRYSNRILFGATAGVGSANGFITFETANANTLSERLRITSDGNVGIGTTSPSAKLHVYNGEAIIATSTDGIKLSYSVGNSSGIIDTAFSDNNLEFRTNGSTKMWIANGGNVGIGTTSPGAKLHINSSVSDGIILRTTANVEPFIAIQRNSGSNGVAVLRSIDGGHLYVDTGATGATQSTKMTVTAGGNVGIGTTSPARKLDVNGTSIFRDFTTVVSSNGNPVSNTTWLSSDSGITNIYTGGNSTVQLNSNGVSYFNGGNVGIGTTNPSYKLDVNGSAGIYGDLNFTKADGIGINAKESLIITIDSDNNDTGRVFQVREGSGNTLMLIQEAGNVGIGTTSPGAKLHVDDSSADAVIRISKGASTIGNIDLVNEGNRFSIQDDGARRFSIDTSGNVGIGVASPVQKLDVAGKMNISDDIILAQTNGRIDYDNGVSTGALRFWSTNGGAERMRITSDGKLGVGTTSPISRIDVGSSAANAKIVIGTYVASNFWSGIGMDSSDAGVRIAGDMSTAISRLVDVGFYSNDANHNWTSRLKVVRDGTVTISGYGAGLLQTDANGVVSLDTTAYLPSSSYVAPAIEAGGGTPALATGVTAAEIRTLIDVDQAGTDNSTNVTLAGSYDYLTLSGQEITLGQVDYSTDITNLPTLGTAAASAATDFVAVTGDDMTGALNITVPNADTSLSLKRDVSGTVYTYGSFNNAGSDFNINGTGNVFINADSNSDSTSPDRNVTIGNRGVEYMRVRHDGNVGIGTTSPANKLHIKTSDNTSYGLIFENSASNTAFIGFSSQWGFDVNAGGAGGNWLNLKGGATGSSGGITMHTLDTERVRITHDGNVGIGTTATVTNSLLNVAGGINITTGIIGFDTSDYFTLNGKTQPHYGFNLYPLSASPIGISGYFGISLATEGSERIRILGNGNVGIGTTNPTDKLEVSGGNVKVGNNYLFGWRYSSVDSNMYNYIYSSYDDTTTGIAYRSGSWTSQQDIVAHNFQTYSGGWATRLAILQNGNVGIGTTNPLEKLDVRGSTYISGYTVGFDTTPQGNYAYRLTNDGGNSFLNLQGGNVGINTTNPGAKLDVSGTGRFSQDTTDYTLVVSNAHASLDQNYISLRAGATQIGAINRPVGTNDIFLFSYYGNLTFGANTGGNATERMRITTGGNVGINTTNPQDLLHIRTGSGWGARITYTGDDSYLRLSGNQISAFNSLNGAADLYLNHSSGGNILVSNTGSNVGIGTTSPNYKLDVYGTQMRVYNSAGEAGYVFQNQFGAVIFGVASGSGQILNSGGAAGDVILSNRAGGRIILSSDSSYNDIHAVIKETGEFGIGTGSPATKLHVVGTAETRLRVGSSNASSNVVLELRDENSPTGQGTVITYNNATGETYFNNAYSGATTDFHFQSGEYGSASDFFTLSNAGGNSIVQMSTTTGDAFITYEGATNEMAIASDGDLRLTTPTDQDVFFISSGGNIDMTKAGGNVDMGGNLTVDGNTHLAGSLGIGISSPAVKLEIQDTTHTTFKIRSGNNDNVLFLQAIQSDNGRIGTETNIPLSFYTNSAERLRIKGDGNVGIGTTNPGVALDVVGTIRATGDVIAYYSSDQRLKLNIKPIASATEKVKKLGGYEFDWDETKQEIYKGHDYGVMAQEVEAVLPELVTTKEDGYKAVKYEKIIALLIESNKELSARIEQLEAKLK